MTQLAASGLETATYGQPGWVHIYNHCVRRLNAVLLKINALLDVDVEKLKDGAILTWDAAAGKWKPKAY